MADDPRLKANAEYLGCTERQATVVDKIMALPNAYWPPTLFYAVKAAAGDGGLCGEGIVWQVARWVVKRDEELLVERTLDLRAEQENQSNG